MRISYKPLWRILLEKEISKKQLREMSGISTASLAKLGKGENLTTDVSHLMVTGSHFIDALAIHESLDLGLQIFSCLVQLLDLSLDSQVLMDGGSHLFSSVIHKHLSFCAYRAVKMGKKKA